MAELDRHKRRFNEPDITGVADDSDNTQLRQTASLPRSETDVGEHLGGWAALSGEHANNLWQTCRPRPSPHSCCACKPSREVVCVPV